MKNNYAKILSPSASSMPIPLQTMSLFTEKSAIIITCHKRITPYLENEVKQLGFTIDSSFITGVSITGTIRIV